MNDIWYHPQEQRFPFESDFISEFLPHNIFLFLMTSHWFFFLSVMSDSLLSYKCVLFLLFLFLPTKSNVLKINNERRFEMRLYLMHLLDVYFPETKRSVTSRGSVPARLLRGSFPYNYPQHNHQALLQGLCENLSMQPTHFTMCYLQRLN